jgi:RHS repeat-associated protein
LSLRHANWIHRAIAAFLAPALAFTAIPAPAAETTVPRTEEVQPQPVAQASPAPREQAGPKKPGPNRTVPKVQPPRLVPVFSAVPTDAEFFKARVFAEPLVPSATTSPEENIALANALARYLAAKDRAELDSIEGFLERHPRSPWRVSLLANLGMAYRRGGYFSRALAASKRAWEEGADAEQPQVRALADRALGEVAALQSRLGHREELRRLLADVQDHPLVGPAAELLVTAREALAIMDSRPEIAYRCGPLAIESLLAVRGMDDAQRNAIDAYPSTDRGTSLAQMEALSSRVGMSLQMAFREKAASILTPALVHWRSGHFAALVREEQGRYLLKDPTFGDEAWVGRAAVEDEADGYFLVASGSLPTGWRQVGAEEGDEVWGKGVPQGNNPQPQSCKNKRACKPCQPLAQYTFLEMLVALNINDAPVSYSPPRGPAIEFAVNYNQRDVFQPQIFTYSNLGPKWTFDWLSYVSDDPGNSAQTVTVYLRGGGEETYASYNPVDRSYSTHYDSGAQLFRTDPTSVAYERRLPDGSVEVFGQPDGALAFPRKVFLTEWRDPPGNSVKLVYDTELRLVALVDAIGQVTTLDYDLATDPLKITRVTDPFGRAASLEYDATGKLASITDVIGLTSQFTYDASDFVTRLDTPYGTSRFAWGVEGTGRFLELTDPLGARERVEYQPGHMFQFPPADADADVPAGFGGGNSTAHLDTTLSFYWDKRAMGLYPGDYTKAEMINWTVEAVGSRSSGTKRTVKKPLESRVWYGYAGQNPPGWYRLGSTAFLTAMARRLDDGSTQSFQYEYNAKGNKTRETDPVGRTTLYTYDAAAGIDLLEVRQVNGQSTDLLRSHTYNSQHMPLTSTDAAGRTTTATYNAYGQVATVTTPQRAGITENRTTTLTYDSNGYLQSIAGPVSGATVTLTYDGYGRVRTRTDPAGYTATYDYDALDRKTKVTHPDGTYEQVVYNRLDAEQRRDRLGRWSRTFYDALRRPTAMRDAAGRTATQGWCNCGSLDKLIDANNNATTWERDLQGRVTKETRADSNFTQLVYENTTSRLKQRIDRKNQTKTYDYFPDDRLKQVSYTNAQYSTAPVSHTYDAVHPRRATMTDGTGTTTWTYNAITTTPTLGAGLLASVSGPVGGSSYTMSFSYDELGRAVSRSINGASVTDSFDALGRVSSELDPLGTFGYSYVGATRRLSGMSFPNSQTTAFTYFDNQGDNRLQEIKHLDPGAVILSKFNYIYDKVGTIQTWSQQAGTGSAKVHTLGYDAAIQLTSAVISGVTPLPIPSRFAYGYDNAGNRTAEQLDDAVTSATYNNLDRLVSTQAGGALIFGGTLSEQATVTVGGATAQVATDNSFRGSSNVPPGTSNVVVAATDPSGNVRTNTYQISQSGSTKTLTYDLNGNLTNDGTRTYEWDAENRLLAVNQGTHRSEFTYNGLDQRVRIVEKENSVLTSDRRFVWCGVKTCEERDSSGATVVRAFYRHGILDGGVKYFTTTDHLGSTREITNNSGAVVARYEYDPYGRTTKVSGTYDTSFGFTGHYFHAPSGLALPLYRAYAADVGRWTSEDPAGHLDGPNLYRYVRNSPSNFTDATGELTGIQSLCVMVFITVGAAAGGAAGGAAAAPGGITIPLGMGAGGAAGAAMGGAVGLWICAPPPITMCPTRTQSPQPNPNDPSQKQCYEQYYADAAFCGQFLTDDALYSDCMDLAWQRLLACVARTGN